MEVAVYGKAWDIKPGHHYVLCLLSLSRLHGRQDDDLGVCFLNLENTRDTLSHHRLLVRKFNICKIYRYLMQPEKINTFKPTICWFFLMAAPLSFYFENHPYTSLLKVTPLTNLVWKKLVFSFVSILLLNFSFCFSFSF